MQTPFDLKQMTGVMNLDDSSDVFPPFHHKYLMNGRFRGAAGGGLRVETIPGNILVPNYLLPAGTNECIGAYFDSVNQIIFWFNWNSNGRNGIYKYNIKTSSIGKVFLCFTDSVDDILHFDRDFPIHSCAIIYRTESDGDLLYWTDAYRNNGNRPRYINVSPTYVSTYAPFIEDMINAGKDAPLLTLTGQYGDDATITVNNLWKKLFRFAYRYKYANLEYSTISPISSVPLPDDGFNQDELIDPTKNNIILLTGVARLSDNATIGDIVGVEILGQECKGSVFSDFFLITTILRTDFSAGAFSFRFLNDSVYTGIDPAEANLYYSYLPDKANTLESLRGTNIIYGGITEGYPNLTEAECQVVLWSGLGEGANALVINLQQTSTFVLTGIIGGRGLSSSTIAVQFEYDNGTQFNVSVSISPPNTDLGTITASFVAALNAEFLSLGINAEVSAVQIGIGNTFTITTTNPAGSFNSIELLNTSLSTVPYPVSVLKWGSQYRWGLIYFDERGKTNGVISFVNTTSALNNFGYISKEFVTMQPPPSNQFVPYMMASINHLPPSWARRFQWVRTANKTTDYYLELVTNDYQTDSDYLYFCIQNLTYLKTKNTGFLPSYDYVPGDRVKVLASYNSANGFRTEYTVYEYEIAGTVERTMTIPASNGTFLKVKKPSIGLPAYTANMFIEIYRPLLRTEGAEQVFFEFGDTFELNANQPGSDQLYHGGNLDSQDATQPATFLFYKGDSYFKPRIFYLNVGDTATKTMTIMDRSYSDYFASKVNSDGRGWDIEPQARTEYISNGMKWGGSYISGTNINQVNIFQQFDFDESDRGKGDIWRFKARDGELRIFLDRATGRTGIFAKYIEDSSGESILTTTNDIITTNNIQYYQGEIGLGGQPTALVSSVNADYISDCVRGIQARLSGEGFTEISTLYKGQYTIKNYLTPYNKPYLRTNGTKSKIIGYYDFFESEYHPILQEGSLNGSTIPNRHFSFNEPRNAYTGFFGFQPEWAISAEDITYSWKNGNIYIHNDNGSDRKFYNEYYNSVIRLVFNDKEAVRKKYLALGYQSPDKWSCDNLTSFVPGQENIDAIVTSFINPQTGFQQSSQLKPVDIDTDNNEGQITAAFLRDINSGTNPNLALLEGDFLLGWYMEVEFTYRGHEFSFFYNPYVTYNISNRNF